MTISSTTRKAGPYTGNGSTTQFPFTFKVFSASDVLVVRTDPDGVESTLTLGGDYTVTLNADQDANPGGTVVMNAAPAAGYLITLSSALPALQPVVLTNQGGFYPRILNDALDRLTILVQQIAEQVSRAVKTKISSNAVPDDLITQIVSNAVAVQTAADNAAAAASAAASSAAQAAAYAANLPNATAAGADKFLKTNTTGTAWDYQTAGQARASLGAAGLADNNVFTGANVYHTYVVVNSSITVDASHIGKLLRVDTTAGPVTIALPGASANLPNGGALWIVHSTGSNPVTLSHDGGGGNLFVDASGAVASYVMNQRSRAFLNTNAGNWFITSNQSRRYSNATGGDMGEGSINVKAAYVNGAALLPITASGSAPLFAPRAWVNFNGTGTVTIRASGNVSSITDNGVGDYTVNFTTALPDADYATLVSFGAGPGNTTAGYVHTGTAQTATAVRVAVSNAGAPADVPIVNVAVFR